MNECVWEVGGGRGWKERERECVRVKEEEEREEVQTQLPENKEEKVNVVQKDQLL